MSEKKPQPGEFWDMKSTRLLIVGTKRNGAVVAEYECGTIGQFRVDHHWQHLSDCDSFDWQPETFPQWYVCGNSIGWGITAYVVRDSPNTYFCVETNGNEVRNSEYVFEQGLVNSGHWKKVTQAEAESRVKKPDPVESPDDWVEFDGWLVAFPRHKIDELKHATESSFEPAIQAWHGKPQQWQASIVNYKIRCRRRDLPPMPQETPKREHVRVWLRWTDDKLYATATGCDDPKDRELKHDGTGFYLEDGK